MKSSCVGRRLRLLAKAKESRSFLDLFFRDQQEMGWGNRFAMDDARTSIGKRSPSRHVTAAVPGGSTNAALHPLAIAHRCFKFDLFDAAEIFKKTPYIAGLKPAGRYVAKDMFEVGGIPLLMKALLDPSHVHGDCLTVTG